MSADPLRDLFARSASIRAVSRVARALEAAARSSALSALVARARAEFLGLTLVHRVRLTGLLIATALATEQLLIRLVPAQVRPAPPAALRYEIALAALVAIAFAPPIARAWPSSRLRRALRFCFADDGAVTSRR